MGYNLTAKQGLNFNRGLRVPLIPYKPKRKVFDYYNRTKRGLGYISPEAEPQTGLASDDFLCDSSNTSKWNSDISLGALCNEFTANMVSYDLTMDLDESEVFEDPEDDAWAKQLEKQ